MHCITSLKIFRLLVIILIFLWFVNCSASCFFVWFIWLNLHNRLVKIRVIIEILF